MCRRIEDIVMRLKMHPPRLLPPVLAALTLLGLPGASALAAQPIAGPGGVTAIAGQVLTAAGKPLANVLLEDGGAAARTNEAGRFLLLFVPPWRSVLTIDGTRAGTSTATDYGYYQVQVMAAPHVTTALPFTSYLTPIDHAHEVTIASPTTAEVVVRTPLVPGYELHIPPRTIITDPHGRRVDKISIAPIPVDRPPFPLPRIGNLPIYLTLQPGGAQLRTTSGKRAEAKVWYPNLGGAPPGTRRVFWHYVPATFGWVPYGEGTVSADGRYIIPDAGVATYAFMGGGLTGSGGYAAPAGVNNGTGNSPANSTSGGEPVDFSTGLFTYSHTDLAISDVLPISVTRSYLSSDNNYRLFGVGMSLSYEMYMIAPPEPPGEDYAAVQVIAPSLGSVTMPNVVGPNLGTFTNAIFMAGSAPGPFFQSRMSWNGAGWNLTRTEGTSYVFGFQQPLQYIQDRFGNRISLAFQQAVPVPTGQQSGPLDLRPVQITSPNGRFIQLRYGGITSAGLDGKPHIGIVQAADDLGRTTFYGYDSCGRLTSVINADGGVTQYGWSPTATCGGSQSMTFSTLTTITSPNASTTSGLPVLTNAYCPTGGDTNCPPVGGPGSIQGRVERQMLVQTGSKVPTYFFSYAADTNNNIYQATVSDPLGKKRIVDFSTSLITGPHCAAGAASTPPPPYTAGYPIADCEAVNNSQVEQDTIYARDASTNLIDSMTDPLGRVTDWSYDSLGNVLSVTQLAGTSGAVTTSFTYAPPFS